MKLVMLKILLTNSDSQHKLKDFIVKPLGEVVLDKPLPKDSAEKER